MPHYKCTPCKTRLHVTMPDPGHHQCPGCGGRFEPVSDLSEIVGYRAVFPEPGVDRWLDDGGAPPMPRALAVTLPRPPE